jgi:cellulose synthase/poly-beta-1,6-N-acetylglucosamine synthase-like glycosyltransferase
MKTLFWISFIVLVYIYAGYPFLAWLFARLFGRPPAARGITPPVSLLIPAYNEAGHMDIKLRNSLALDYPMDRLEIVVASDGSTDQTDAITRRFEPQGVRLIVMRENIGKSAMLSRAVPLLRGDLIVFSDASSELEPGALRALVRNFADPKVGCASGLYRLRTGADLRGEGEGLYWRYETFLKRQESRLHSILGAHGAFYAIRKALFQRFGESEINDDYLVPMRIIAQGYRAIYEPEALAWERETASVEGEFARRRRIAAGNCQQMVALRRMLSPFYGWVAWSFFSHKVLRTLAPVFLLLLLVSSLWLPQPERAAALGAQGALYGAALLGYWCQRRGRRVRWLSAPFYFCFGNMAMLAGVLQYASRRDRIDWGRIQAGSPPRTS